MATTTTRRRLILAPRHAELASGPQSPPCPEENLTPDVQLAASALDDTLSDNDFARYRRPHWRSPLP